MSDFFNNGMKSTALGVNEIFGESISNVGAFFFFLKKEMYPILQDVLTRTAEFMLLTTSTAMLMRKYILQASPKRT